MPTIPDRFCHPAIAPETSDAQWSRTETGLQESGDQHPAIRSGRATVCAGRRERRSTELSVRESAPAAERQSQVNDPMPPARAVSDLRDPLGHGVDSSAALATIPFRVVVAKPRRRRQVGKRRRAYSFVGGSLIGIAVALPAFALDAEEGDGTLLLFGSVTLAAAGVGMHLRGLRETGKPTNKSLVAPKDRRRSS